MSRPQSRPDRWHGIVKALLASMEVLDTTLHDVEAAVEELVEVLGEYAEWQDNLPENMAGTATAEKLDEVVELDVQSAFDEAADALQNLQSVAEAASAMDLPRGFGRD